MGAFGLERFGRDHEDAAANLGHGNLPSPLQPAHITVAQAGVHCEKHHASQMCGQLRKESVLFIPGDGVGQPRRFGQHGDQRWYCLEPRPAIVVTVGPGRAIEDRAYDFEATVNRGGADTRGKPVRDKGLERGIVDLLSLETSEM